MSTPANIDQVLIGVIGSGISAVSFAKQIEQLYNTHKEQNDGVTVSIRIIILEGRNRIGGRTYSIPLDNTQGEEDDDIWVDMGASWIEGMKKNPITELTKTLGLNTCPGRKDLGMRGGYYHLETGTCFTDSPLRGYMKKVFYENYERLEDVFFGSSEDNEDAECDDKEDCNEVDEEGEESEEETEEEIIVKQQMVEKIPDRPLSEIFVNPDSNFIPNFAKLKDPTLGRMFWNSILGYYGLIEGESLEKLSLNQFISTPILAGDDLYMVSTYGKLVKKLIESLQLTTIELEQSVSHIEECDNKIHVKTRNGQSYQFDYCVCTAPLGVLQSTNPLSSISFNPPLSEIKQKSISAMGMGLLDKVIIQFKTPVWNKLDSKIKTLSESGKFYLFINMAYYDERCDNKPLLIAFISGQQARELEEKSDDLIMEEILGILQSFFPEHNIRDLVVKSHITRWNSDPFSLGSYSYPPIGASMKDISNLALSEYSEKLRFCGEHTATYFSYAQ